MNRAIDGQTSIVRRPITRRGALTVLGLGISAGTVACYLRRPLPPKRPVIIYQTEPGSSFQCRDLGSNVTTSLPFGDDGWQWNFGGVFHDGQSLFLWSREWAARAYKPGFSNDYYRFRTKFWIYDAAGKRLTEVFDKATKHMEPVCLLPDGNGMLVDVSQENGTSVIFAFDWDGKMLFPFSDSGMAKRYGFSWSPDRTRLLYHVAGPDPLRYYICTSDVDGHNQIRLCAEHDRNIFGPQWSPDGRCVCAIAFDWKPTADYEGADVYLIDAVTRRCRNLGVRHWANARTGPLNHRARLCDTDWIRRLVVWIHGVCGFVVRDSGELAA